MVSDDHPSSSLQRGRRASARLRLRLAARLVLLDGTHPCILTDLSAGGARVLPQTPVSLRKQAVLLWGKGMEAFGEVVWTSSSQCGIAFDEPLAEALLQATRQLNEKERLPQDRELLRGSAQGFVQGGVRL